MKHFTTLFLLFTLLLAACAPTAPTQAPQAAEPITVTDALGREVKLDKLPQRIAVTGKASLMILDALYMFPEAKERVVAFEDAVQGDVNFIQLLDPKYPERHSCSATPAWNSSSLLNPTWCCSRAPRLKNTALQLMR